MLDLPPGVQGFTNDIVPNHRDPKEWEGRDGTTIQTTSKPFIGGAIRKKAQPELRIKVLGFGFNSSTGIP